MGQFDCCGVPGWKLDGLGRIFRGMETTVGRVLFLLVSIALAAMVASTMVQIAYDVFGLSRENIRVVAVIAALLIGALLAAEYFGKRLRKPK